MMESGHEGPIGGLDWACEVARPQQLRITYLEDDGNVESAAAKLETSFRRCKTNHTTRPYQVVDGERNSNGSNDALGV